MWHHFGLPKSPQIQWQTSLERQKGGLQTDRGKVHVKMKAQPRTGKKQRIDFPLELPQARALSQDCDFRLLAQIPGFQNWGNTFLFL